MAWYANTAFWIIIARTTLRWKACLMAIAGRAGWPEAEVVPGIATGGAGGRGTTAGQSSDFAEVELAWIEALREVGVSVRSSAVA
jgi:hypothetical protein